MTDLRPAPRGRANQPKTLRDKIEEAAMACQSIALALSLLSRNNDLHGDFAGALSALERLALHTADDVDALLHHLPAP